MALGPRLHAGVAVLDLLAVYQTLSARVRLAIDAESPPVRKEGGRERL